MSEENADQPIWDIVEEIRALFAAGEATDDALQELVERAYCYGQHMMAEGLCSWAEKYKGLHEED